MNKRQLLNFTSGTTSGKECINMLFFCNDKVNYRDEYHKRLKKLYSVKYAFSYAAGRIALYSILKALNIGEGDEVILQGYTCCAVPKAVLYAGAEPIYADITEEDYNLSFESVKSNISDKTKAIVIQHTYGIPCQSIFGIKKLCEEKNIYLIEDCAHVLLTDFKGYKLGTIGDVAFFSTDHTKVISTSVGGYAITNNSLIGDSLARQYNLMPELTRKEEKGISIQFSLMNILRSKRINWYVNEYKVLLVLERMLWGKMEKNGYLYYLNDYSNTEFPKYSFPAKLSNRQAMIGISQLKKRELNINHRKELTAIYKRELGQYKGVPKCDGAMLRFPLLVDNPKHICESLKSVVSIEDWFRPVLECAKYEELGKFKYNYGSCPIAEHISNHIINLPIHMKITCDDAVEICKLLKQV